MTEFYEQPLPIRTYDIDFAGIVSNIVFIRWLEDLAGRMRVAGLSRVRWRLAAVKFPVFPVEPGILSIFPPRNRRLPLKRLGKSTPCQ